MSQIISINAEKQTHAISVLPNPAKNSSIVQINAASDGKATITLLNLSGKVLTKSAHQILKGNNNIHLNQLARYAAGLYTIQVIFDQEIHHYKLIITR